MLSDPNNSHLEIGFAKISDLDFLDDPSLKEDHDLMRKELQSYLEQLDKKKGSDGELLVKVPSNFNLIVSSMNREDLYDDDNQDTKSRVGNYNDDSRSWSRYLLLDGLMSDEVASNDFDGRYKNLFSNSDTPVEKIKKGLAQIQMLDRQLSEATRKSNTFLQQKQSDANRTRQAGGMLLDSLSTPTAYDGVVIDETFMTKERQQSGTVDLNNSVAYSNDGMDSEIDLGSSADMTADEQSRLDALLIGDSEDLSFLGPYFDLELQKASHEVDIKLSTYDRMERLHISDEDELLRFDSNHHPDRPADYLGEQRQKRAIRRHTSKIDALLKACSDHIVQDPDLSIMRRPMKIVDVIPAISDVLTRGVSHFMLSERDVASLLQSITDAHKTDGKYGEDKLGVGFIGQCDMVGLTYAENIRINKLLKDCRAQIEGIKRQKATPNVTSPSDAKNGVDTPALKDGTTYIREGEKLLDFNESVPLAVLNANHSAVDTTKVSSQIAPSEHYLPMILPNMVKVKQSCTQDQPFKSTRNTKNMRLSDPSSILVSPRQKLGSQIAREQLTEGVPFTVFRSPNTLSAFTTSDSIQSKLRMKEQQISNILSVAVPNVVPDRVDTDVIADRRDKKKSIGVKSMRI